MKKKKKKNKQFKLGDSITFNFKLYKKMLENLSEEEKIKRFGSVGYGRPKNNPLVFTYICEHFPQNDHCVLVNMSTKEITIMRHISDYRFATEDET